MQARLLLCHVTRRVSEASICKAAADQGFAQTAEFEPGKARQWIAEPFRLLCFAIATTPEDTEESLDDNGQRGGCISLSDC